MMIKYNIEIDKEILSKDFDRIVNQIFKLLPSREEGGDWVSPLQNLIIELAGMDRLFEDQLDLFIVICKLEGLLTLTKDDDFYLFRKTIFETLGTLSKMKQQCQL